MERKTEKQGNRQKDVVWETGSIKAEVDRHQALCLGSPSFFPLLSFLPPC